MSEESQYKIPPEHMTDPKHGYLIGSGFNWSKWVRENVPQAKHKFKVGDVVVLTVTAEIEKLIRDCDGTPLYVLSNGLGGGWGEEGMRLATNEEITDY